MSSNLPSFSGTDDPFESPRALVHRASEHIHELHARFCAFMKRNPYTKFIEVDEATGEKVHGAKFGTGTVPSSVTVVAFDIVNCLRSALDHAVYAAAVALGEQDPTSTKFPFGDTAQHVKDDIARTRPKNGIGGIPVELGDFLIAQVPHGEPGGNETLWAFNKFRNIKNHRKLVRIGIDVQQVHFSGGLFIDTDWGLGQEWNAERNKFIYLRIGPGGQAHYDLNLTVFPEIGDVVALGGKPAIGIFNHIAREVDRIINGLEAETERIVSARP